MTWMIGIDTGGTFTDVIGMNRLTGELRTVKVPSTPRDPSQAIPISGTFAGTSADFIGITVEVVVTSRKDQT